MLAGVVWVVAAAVAFGWPDPTAEGSPGVRWCAARRWCGRAGDVRPAPARLQPAVRRRRRALTHLLFAATVLLWPSPLAFTLGVAVSAWLLLFGTRIIVHGRDRLRHRDRPDQVAMGRWSPKLRVAREPDDAAGRGAGRRRCRRDRQRHHAGAGGVLRHPDRSSTATPGTLLRRQVIDPFVDGATTYRVLYTSRDLDGTPATASGLVIVPDDGEVPDGGRPILAFTHGTIGVARSCAPSLLDGAYAEQMWGLEAFLDAGWIVTAPDYLGLGSEGVHPYLVGQTAAENTLDAVRAAIGLAGDEASSRFAVAGHSQGGHAAMFTGQQAPTYAPELDLVAVAGLAPASELAAFIEANDGTTFGNLLGAYAVVAWDRAFDDIDATDIVDPAVLPIVERLADACVATGPEAIALLTDAELLQLGFLVSPIWQTEPWASRIAENTPGAEPIDAPLLIVQGTEDVLIRADIQRRFVSRLCEPGQQLEYREFTDVGHLGVDDTADDYVVEWLTDRLTTHPPSTPAAPTDWPGPPAVPAAHDPPRGRCGGTRWA
jgi:acetyl esterase/lipase